MFFNNPFKFYKGYVIISIEGASPERFINICARRGIRLWDIAAEKDGVVRAYAAAADFARMRVPARKSGVRISIAEKHTKRTAARYAVYRMGFVVGITAFVVFCAVSSAFIWKVEVSGNTITPSESIIAAAEKAGVYPGAKKSSLPELGVIKYIILDNSPGVSWAWVYIEGSKARIEVREGAPPPETADESEGCDVAAVTDGMIKSVMVKKGYPRVKPGDGVSAGDELVSGLMPSKVDYDKNPVEYYPVHADAEVLAYTWHEKSGSFPMSYTSKAYTGAVKRRYTLHIFSHEIKLFRDESVPFAEYESADYSHEFSVFGKYMGISADEERFLETVTNTEPLSEEAAAELAARSLEEEISAELTPGAVLEDRELSWSVSGNNTIDVRLTMKFTENIGTQIPHKRSERFDTTND